MFPLMRGICKGGRRKGWAPSVPILAPPVQSFLRRHPRIKEMASDLGEHEGRISFVLNLAPKKLQAQFFRQVDEIARVDVEILFRLQVFLDRVAVFERSLHESCA